MILFFKLLLRQLSAADCEGMRRPIGGINRTDILL